MQWPHMIQGYPTFCMSTKGKINNKHMQVLPFCPQILNMHDTSICLIVQNMQMWHILPNIINMWDKSTQSRSAMYIHGNMLNMLMNITAWHIWKTYLNLQELHMLILCLYWVSDTYKVLANSKMYFGCAIWSYLSAYLTYSHGYTWLIHFTCFCLTYS